MRLTNESWGLDNVKVYLDGHSGDGWPVVTIPPQSQTLLVGGSANLSVTVAGAVPLASQWLKNGTPLPGATNLTLQIVGAQTNDAGSYKVLVTNLFGSTVSAPGILARPAGPVTPADGPWGQQAIVMLKTPEAALMAPTGDIDNLGFGWPANFDPFSGNNTPGHGFPWALDPSDPAGTDRIAVPTGYVGNPPRGKDGYTSNTSRPANLPQAITLSYGVPEFTNLVVTSAVLQMFVDDFQALVWGSSFQVTIKGLRAPFLETFLNALVQTGPIGKLITVPIPSEFLEAVRSGQLALFIDDPTTGAGDGFAIDFVKLLINPGILSQIVTLSGRVIDQQSGLPLPGAAVSISGGAGALTDGSGYLAQTQVVQVISGQTNTFNLGLSLDPPILSGFTTPSSNGVFGVRLTGLSGLTPVVLYASTNLVNWAPVFTLPFVTGVYEFLDLEAKSYPKRFYRAALATSSTVPAPFIQWELLTNSPSGSFMLRFSGLPNATYRVWSSTNLAAWSVLGSPDQIAAGQFGFTDAGATNWLRRFYRVSAP